MPDAPRRSQPGRFIFCVLLVALPVVGAVYLGTPTTEILLALALALFIAAVGVFVAGRVPVYGLVLVASAFISAVTGFVLFDEPLAQPAIMVFTSIAAFLVLPLYMWPRDGASPRNSR